MAPRPNEKEKARSKAEKKPVSPAQKPDLGKRPTAIGATKADTVSPTNAPKQRGRKPSVKAFDSPGVSLSPMEISCLPSSQNIAAAKSQKLTSPLNSPLLVKDQQVAVPEGTTLNSKNTSRFQSPPLVSTNSGLITGSESVISTTLPHFGVPRDHEKHSPPKDTLQTLMTITAGKKSDKPSQSNRSSVSNGCSNVATLKSSSNSTTPKKRKTNKGSGTDEEGKKKQKTHANLEKKSLYSSVNCHGGKEKLPILPPSPFPSKSSAISGTQET